MYLTLGDSKLKPGRGVKRRGWCPEPFLRGGGEDVVTDWLLGVRGKESLELTPCVAK